MISLAPTNAVALQLLQSPGTQAAPEQINPGANVLKVANGVSVESSAGTKSAAAMIGKFSVDSAFADKPISGKLVIGDLGSFDTWEEAKAYVNGNDNFSTSQKKDWIEKINGYAKGLEEFKTIQASDLYQSSMSGPIRDEWLAMQEAGKGSFALSAEHVKSMDKILTSLGRETLTESLSRAPNNILPK